MSEILNHLQNLTEYGYDYTEDDKKIFLEVEQELSKTYNLKYMNAPVDITPDGIATGISSKSDKDINNGFDLANDISNYILEKNEKYNFIQNNNLYIYQLGKIKCIKDEKVSFSYTIRIGSFNAL